MRKSNIALHMPCLPVQITLLNQNYLKYLLQDNQQRRKEKKKAKAKQTNRQTILNSGTGLEGENRTYLCALINHVEVEQTDIHL